MAKTKVEQYSFAAGEISPRLLGRSDFPKYYSAADTLENFLITHHGAIERRPGLQFVAEVKDSTRKTRLIAFQFSTIQSYILEIGHQYFRFYKDGGRIQLNVSGAVNNGSGLIRITTSVAHTMTTGMRVVISGVGGVPNANGTWIINKIDATRFDLQGSSFAGLYTAGGIVIPELTDVYVEGDLDDMKFTQSADTLYIVHPSYPPRKLIRLSHTDWRIRTVDFVPPGTLSDTRIPVPTTLSLSGITGNITLTAGDAVFEDGDIGRQVQADNGGKCSIKTLIGAAPTTQVTAEVTVDFPDTVTIPNGSWKLLGSPNLQATPSIKAPVGQIATVTLVGGRGFRPGLSPIGDRGRFCYINNGIIKITTVDTPSSATGPIVKALDNAVAAVAGTWTLEAPAFGVGAAAQAANQQPRAMTFFEGRQYIAATNNLPQNLWGSVSDSYENYARGTKDDDGLDFTLASPLVDSIVWMMSLNALFLGTFGGIHRVTGGTQGPVTPANINVRSESAFGASLAQPVRVGNAIVYIQRNKSRIRELAFNFDTDGFVSQDLTLLADHLGDGFAFSELSFQQNPWSIVYGVRSDGQLCAMTYLRDQNIVGWGRINSPGGGGIIERIATIPHHAIVGYDSPWVITKRTINGIAKRYIEYFDTTLMTDAALTRTPTGVKVTTVSGLTHLANMTVDILGDGAYQGQRVVSVGGVVTIDPPADKVEVGLPYTSKLTTLPIARQGISYRAVQKRPSKVIVELYKTSSLEINGIDVPFRLPSDKMDKPIPPFTGEIDVTAVGFDKLGKITARQPRPFATTLLGIAVEFTLDSL